jgi:uncharacterized membrane protein (UPF0127 family)
MEVNSTTYGLVKTKIKHVIVQVWMKNIPIYIFDIVLLEQTAIVLYDE